MKSPHADEDRPEVSIQEIDMVLKDIMHSKNLYVEAPSEEGGKKTWLHYFSSYPSEGLDAKDLPKPIGQDYLPDGEIRDQPGSREFWRRSGVVSATMHALLYHFSKDELHIGTHGSDERNGRIGFRDSHLILASSAEKAIARLKSAAKGILESDKEVNKSFYNQAVMVFQNSYQRANFLPMQEARDAAWVIQCGKTEHLGTIEDPAARTFEVNPISLH